MKQLRFILVLVVVLSCALPASALGSVGGHVSRIVARSGFGGASTGIVIYDQTSGRTLYKLHSRAELRPASNMKLTTTMAAFGYLGAGTRLSTQVYRNGTMHGRRLTGSLWLVGGGDPTLSTPTFGRRAFHNHYGHLADLADAVRAAGIRSVSGRVFGDESMFDTRRTGPYWKPSYWMDCPPISALTVNKDLKSFFKPNSYAQPALRAASVLRSSLTSRGVKVGHDPRVRGLPSGATLVATVQSPRISRLVQLMNRPSDNFLAEVLNKRVAVEQGMRGTTRNGRRVTGRYLRSLGINTDHSRMYDGSGLSPRDRLSARQILAILRRASALPYASAFRASLAVAGVNGTLSKRMRTGPAHRNARAKTGTLDNASALSGYVTSRNDHKLVFSILVNGGGLDITAAHHLQDAIVQALAGSRPRG